LKHGGNEKFQQGISFIAISCLVWLVYTNKIC
jgi:hypothetical protein